MRGGLATLLALAWLLGVGPLQGVYSEYAAPSESECRPYIERALKEHDHDLAPDTPPASLEDTGSSEETAGPEIPLNEQSDPEATIAAETSPESGEVNSAENVGEVTSGEADEPTLQRERRSLDDAATSDGIDSHEQVEGSTESLEQGVKSATEEDSTESAEQGDKSTEDVSTETLEMPLSGEDSTESGENVEQSETSATETTSAESTEQEDGTTTDEASIESSESLEQGDTPVPEDAGGNSEESSEEGTEPVIGEASAESVEEPASADAQDSIESTESLEQGDIPVPEDAGGNSGESSEESTEPAIGEASAESVEEPASADAQDSIESTESVEQPASSAESTESGEELASADAQDSIEGTDSVEQPASSAESTESGEEPASADAQDSIEGTDSVEQPASSAESTESGEELASADAQDSIEGTDSVEQPASSAESTESGEEPSADAQDSIEGTDSVEQPASSAESTESGEEPASVDAQQDSIESTESVESSEGSEQKVVPAESSESSEQDITATETTESSEEIPPAESTESVEQDEAAESAEGESKSTESAESQEPQEQASAESVEEEEAVLARERRSLEEGGVSSEEVTASSDSQESGEETVAEVTPVADEEDADLDQEAPVTGAAAPEQDEEETEVMPEEELSFDVDIPDNLRPRDHIAQILKLDETSVEDEMLVHKVEESTLKELKRLYDNAIKPLEILYKYRDLSNRHFGDPEIFSKPLILFMGPWSGGKSTIINYLLDNEYTRTTLRTGAEPSPAYFNLVSYGEREEVLDGTQLAADWTFSGLQKFGQGLLDRLKGLRLKNRLLEKVNIVEIPGILEIRKQVERLFPFNDACQWFIDRADIIFLVYDPSKLDVGPETEAILDQLKGREYQTRIVLNKADQVRPEELMRVQGTLIWNISPLMSSSQPPVMYSTSLWSMPYEAGAPLRLLRAQERAFLRDMREAIDKRVENKIASARRFAVRVRNHAKMVDCYLTTYYNHMSFFGNRKRISDDIIEKPQDYHIYEGLSTLTNISRYDLPDPETYRDFFQLNPLYDFQQLAATCTYFKGCPINRLDIAIAYDLPELVGKYKKAAEIAIERLDPAKS